MKVLSIAATFTLALAFTNANAQFSATVGVTTDYDYRGVTQTDEDPAVQVSFDFEHDEGIYAGVWASKVDFLDCCKENIEVDWYAGYAWDYRDLSFDVGYNFYSYPGADSLDYGEIYIGGAYGPVEVYYWYADNFFNVDQSAFYLESNASFELPQGFAINLHAGYTAGDALEAEFETGLQEYLDYAVGVSRSFGNFEGDLRYINTDLPGGFGVDSRIIVTISTTFPWGDE